MSNLLDYLIWRGDLPMQAVPFQAVDSLVLCRLSYVSFDDLLQSEDEPVSIRQAAQARLQTLREGMTPLGKPVSAQDQQLLALLSGSERFAGWMIRRYVNELDAQEEKQFSAMTLQREDGFTYIAYRGTDNTLVGWKEDFNMSFRTPVPAQQAAVQYLVQTAAHTVHPLCLGGHSKGGNLAVYAASFCPPHIQARIVGVYNNDGPGFQQSTIEQPGYQAIKERVHTFVPQSSVIGMLMEHEEAYTVVHSTQVGLLQHDVYSWEVKRDDFVRLESVTNSSRVIDHTLKDWVAAMTPLQREQFFDALYEIAQRTQARTIGELREGGLQTAKTVLQSLKRVDEATRQIILQGLKRLWTAARDNLPQPWPTRERPGYIARPFGQSHRTDTANGERGIALATGEQAAIEQGGAQPPQALEQGAETQADR